MATSDECSLPLIESEKLQEPSRFFARAKAACRQLWRALSTSRSRSHNETRPLKKTAYLDGLRGFCAFLVYLHHHLIWSHYNEPGMGVLENAFGWQSNHYFASLPIVRVFFTGGNSAVVVFYLISGYVLSVSPLNALYSTEPTRVGEYLGSAFFRRWIRLFLPVLSTTFIWMTTWHAFDIKSNNKIAKPPETSYGHELWQFYSHFKSYSFMFEPFYWNVYNDHLWSIPLEFRGSVFVWTTILAFARSSAHMRLCLEAGLILYLTLIVDGWYCACFVIGLLLCELDMLAEKDRVPTLVNRLTPKRPWVYWILMLIGLYLAGVPSIQRLEDPMQDLHDLRAYSPGWYYLSFLVPEPFHDYRWFFRIIAGTLVMLSIPQLSPLKGFMESRFCQFLGKHSYALYLVHGPILWSVGDRVYAAVGRTEERHFVDIPKWMDTIPLSGWGPLGLEVNYLVAQLLLLPLTLWVATLVTKTIDEPSVKFARWLFEVCSASPRHSGT